jgi:hypothetical protein
MAPGSSLSMSAGAARRAWLGAAVLSCVGAQPDAPASGVATAGGSPTRAAGELVRIDARELSVTSGEIVAEEPGRFSIRSPTFRAELGRAPRSAVEVSFVYRGPTQELAALASGEPRRQIGLKLRARDTCNVVYAMWHIAPSPGVVVSVKSNPGQSRHAECGDRGYRFLEPATMRAAPPIEPGQPHVLGAEIRGRTLLVKTDGVTSWEGELPAVAFEFDGPIGVRSDNGEFSVALRAEELVQ